MSDIPNKLTIRSGWPIRLKSDLEYFQISQKELSLEAKITKTRVNQLANQVKTKADMLNSLYELHRLTLAFNRIIANRKNKMRVDGWFV